MPELSGDVIGILILVVCLAFIVGAVMVGRRQRAAVDQAYQVLSEQTGLTFTKSSSKGSATLAGNYRGRQNRVYTFVRGAGRSRIIFTGVEVAVSNPTGSTLVVSPANPLGRLLGKGSPSSSGAPGSPEFDSRFAVKSQPPEFAVRMLGDSPLRARLLEISGGYSINLQGGSLKFSRNGRITDSATVEKVLAALADLADRVEGKGGGTA